MDYYQVGTIVNTHGIRGEVRIMATTDFVSERFKKGTVLYLFDKNGKQVISLTVMTYRHHKNFELVTFEGLQDINLVEKYKGLDLKVADEGLQELEEGNYYYHQIIGLDVQNEDKEKIGNIYEILSPGANDVWVVKRQGKGDLLLPVIKDVIKNVNIDNNLVTVELLDGLDD